MNNFRLVSLLALDHAQSVLHPVSHPPSDLIRYVPFGWHPGDYDGFGSIAFNGLFQERLTGHYWLGNGYRVFDTVLMRFHRPDDRSPFGDGGLNAYVYCAADPINRRDDSGHSWALARRAMRQSKLRPSSVEVQRVALASMPSPFEMQNLKQVSPRIFTFETGDQFSIVGHGERLSPGWIQYEGINGINMQALHRLLIEQGTDFKRYSNIHIISCYSAFGGLESSAAKLAQLTQLPVTGYKGLVAGGRDFSRKFPEKFASKATGTGYPLSWGGKRVLNGELSFRFFKPLHNPRTYAIRRS